MRTIKKLFALLLFALHHHLSTKYPNSRVAAKITTRYNRSLFLLLMLVAFRIFSTVEDTVITEIAKSGTAHFQGFLVFGRFMAVSETCEKENSENHEK